jgi:hypothetical protein
MVNEVLWQCPHSEAARPAANCATTGFLPNRVPVSCPRWLVLLTWLSHGKVQCDAWQRTLGSS